MDENSAKDTEVDLCTNCDKPRAKHSVEYGEQLPFCSTNPNDGRRFTPKPDSTIATFSDAEQLAKIRKAIETALSTESLKRSVVTREIADILGLPHEGPDPEAKAFVDRLRTDLAAKGYKR